jgi:phosphatidylserine decarboxylase
MAYSFTENRAGMLQIANTDSGISTTSPAGVVTTIPTPPGTLGMVARAFDPTYGEGEFILLVGVASTVVGSLVTYNATTYQTTLSANTANQATPVAVAMSANTAGLFGWYQIGGLAVVKKTAVAVNAQVPVYQSATVGRVMPTAASGKQVLGARSANLATVASGVSTVIVSINRPHLQGAVT